MEKYLLLVPRVRVELTSEVFQTPAVTTLAISAKLQLAYYTSNTHYTQGRICTLIAKS